MSERKAPEIVLARRIRWADADAAGILHFPRMFEYFEEGETELLRAVGYTWQADAHGMPRRHVAATFHRMLPLDAPFWLRVSIGKLGTTSLRYDFHAYADEALTTLALEGTMTVVLVKDGQPMALPNDLRAQLSPV